MKTIEKVIKLLKKNMILLLVIWFVLAIGIIPAVAITISQGSRLASAEIDSSLPFVGNFMYFLSNPFKTLGYVFNPLYFGIYIETLKNYTGIYFLLAIFLAYKYEEAKPYDGKEYGSARWSKNGEQYKILSKTSGIILAKDNYLPVDKQGNTNVMVIGGSGAGKSASFVIPNVLGLLGSYVFTDPKGELYDKTASYFRANGYDVKVLNLVTPEASDGFNPLLNADTPTDVDIITNTIIRGQDTGATNDPYWDNMAEQLLKALIYFLKATRGPEEANLTSCANLVRLANNSGNFNVVTELMEILPPDHLARKAYKNVELATDKAYSSILSTLQSKLGKFESPEIAALTATNTIDFKDIGKKKTVVYVISSDTHTTYNFILTIFFSQMIQQLYDYADNNGGQLDIPTYFFLDEFANIGQIPDFDKKIATSRSRKISFNIVLQSLDQLEAIYEKSYETILANCDTHLFLGSNSFKTAEWFSKSLGEITIGKEQESKSKGKGEGSRRKYN